MVSYDVGVMPGAYIAAAMVTVGITGATLMAVLVLPATLVGAGLVIVLVDRRRQQVRSSQLEAMARALGVTYLPPDAPPAEAAPLLAKTQAWLDDLMPVDGATTSAGHIIAGTVDGIELLAFDWRVTDQTGVGPDHHQTMLLLQDHSVDLPAFALRPFDRLVSLLEGDDFTLLAPVALDPDAHPDVTAMHTIERLFQQHNRIDADDPLEVHHHLGSAVRAMLANNRHLHLVGKGPRLALFRMHYKATPAQLRERLTDGLTMMALLRDQALHMEQSGEAEADVAERDTDRDTDEMDQA